MAARMVPMESAKIGISKKRTIFEGMILMRIPTRMSPMAHRICLDLEIEVHFINNL
jgi:hypothetical protein